MPLQVFFKIYLNTFRSNFVDKLLRLLIFRRFLISVEEILELKGSISMDLLNNILLSFKFLSTQIILQLQKLFQN